MIGNTIKNTDGEALGTIEELIVDRETGDVAYAVVSFDDLMSAGNTLFAVPWQAIVLSHTDDVVSLHLGKEKLDELLGLVTDEWLDWK